MPGVDERLVELGSSGVLLVVLGVALLLGLRHATDPDHLTAVTALTAGDERHGVRRARRLGLAWGAGHATTLAALGIPIVLFKASLPAAAQQAAEFLVGVLIVALAARLLVRWRAGRFHSHPHDHAGTRHRHVHVHSGAGHGSHAHRHTVLADRSARQAYGLGLLHGVGGSGGTGVVALAGLPDHVLAVFALLLYAGGTAVSMALLSSGLGFALSRRAVATRIDLALPLLGAPSLAFGAWYALGAALA